ncbi:MAG: hypothetical protein WB495_17085 [Xanthobacteraceae bacterium]
MRALLMRSIPTVILLAASGPAWSDDVPQLNVDPVCHGIAKQAAGPGEKGGPDLAFSRCVKNEQAMRQKAYRRMVDIHSVREDQLRRRGNLAPAQHSK